jgi:hypothetical protein
MAAGLSQFARRYLIDEQAVQRELNHPLLVMEAPPAQKEEDLLFGTLSAPRQRPTAGDPLVYLVRKGSSPQNAFAMGVTVGRTENNDIIIADNSVSRFHAYFLQDSKTRDWSLVDVGSSNGTWVGALKLSSSQPIAVPDKARLRFGYVEVLFLTPSSFFTYLREKMTAARPG